MNTFDRAVLEYEMGRYLKWENLIYSEDWSRRTLSITVLLLFKQCEHILKKPIATAYLVVSQLPYFAWNEWMSTHCIDHESNENTMKMIKIIGAWKYRRIYTKPAKCSNLYRIYRKSFIQVIRDTVVVILYF